MTTSESRTATWDRPDRLVASANVTSFQKPPLKDQISSLFDEAKRERFESGYKSNFARQIEVVIDYHGEKAINIIANLILTDGVNPDVADEALRWIGQMTNHITQRSRRDLLERCLLQSKSIFVRDGAGLGLASMDDPDALPALEIAIGKEGNQELKEDLQSVYDQLIDTQNERVK